MEASATEMMATRMVIGRLMAVRTNHIASLLSTPFRDYGFTWRSRAATKVQDSLCLRGECGETELTTKTPRAARNLTTRLRVSESAASTASNLPGRLEPPGAPARR